MTAAEPRFTRDLPEVRRRKLIEATAQCLAEFGHAGTSVRAVAAKANVSPGLVAHHFKGIDDLIVATYDHVGAQVAETLNAAIDTAPDDAESKLRAFIEASFKPPVLDRDLLAIWLSLLVAGAARSRRAQGAQEGLCRLPPPPRGADRRDRAASAASRSTPTSRRSASPPCWTACGWSCASTPRLSRARMRCASPMPGSTTWWPAASAPWRSSRASQLPQVQLQELVAGAVEIRVADGLPVERALQEQPVDQRLQAARDLGGIDTCVAAARRPRR